MTVWVGMCRLGGFFVNVNGGFMSIRIIIDEMERYLAQADKHWIVNQIERRKRDNGRVCVQIVIQQGGMDLRLMSADCPRGNAAGRQATDHEQEVFDLWNKFGLKDQGIEGGHVVAFLNQLNRIV
jgi:hypothetical protein